MAALTSVAPGRSGLATPAAAVAASDTVSRAVLGTRGVLVEVINGNAAADTVTVSDASTTQEGAPAAPISASVPAGTTWTFKITPAQADPVTGNVTITHSVTATVTQRVLTLA